MRTRSILIVLLLLFPFIAPAQSFTKYDLNPDSASSAPSNFVVAGDKMFFTTLNYDTTILWVTDGNPNGMKKLKQMKLKQYTYAFDNLVALNGKAYFLAKDPLGSNYNQLWVSDGTDTGTYMIKEINSSSISGGILNTMIAYNGRLLFFARDNSGPAVWASDGTEAGTSIIYADPKHNWYPVAGFCLFQGKAYFWGENQYYIGSLWYTDGTKAGTKSLQIPGGSKFAMGNYSFCATRDKIFFPQTDSLHGNELWVSDGTVAGTHIVKDIAPGIAGGTPLLQSSTLNNKAFFCASDSNGNRKAYSTDGSDTGTHLFWPDYISSPQPWSTVFKDHFYFNVNYIDSTLVTDGTEAGTKPLTDSNGNFVPQGFLATYNNALYIIQYSGPGFSGSVYKTDGTEKGTYLIKQGTPGGYGLTLRNAYIVFNGSLWISATLDSDGQELWRIDDTTTVVQQPIQPFSIYPNPNHGSFTISTADSNFTGRILICDVAGREVYYNNHVSGSIINVTIPGAAAGVYFLAMQDISDPKTSRTISSYKIVVW